MGLLVFVGLRIHSKTMHMPGKHPPMNHTTSQRTHVGGGCGLGSLGFPMASMQVVAMLCLAVFQWKEKGKPERQKEKEGGRKEVREGEEREEERKGRHVNLSVPIVWRLVAEFALP